MAEAADNVFSLAFGRIYLGELYLRQGRGEPAIAVLEPGFELCRTWDLSLLFPRAAARLGAAYVQDGRVVDGLRLLEESVEYAESRGMLVEASLRATLLGAGYLAAGRIADATQLVRRGLDIAVDQKEPGNEALALRLLGTLSMQAEHPDHDRALRCHRRALALAAGLGMRPLAARCAFGLGRLYRRLGRREQAGAALSTAVESFRSMEMTRWLPAAVAELAAASAPQSVARDGG